MTFLTFLFIFGLITAIYLLVIRFSNLTLIKKDEFDYEAMAKEKINIAIKEEINQELKTDICRNVSIEPVSFLFSEIDSDLPHSYIMSAHVKLEGLKDIYCVLLIDLAHMELTRGVYDIIRQIKRDLDD